MSQSLLPLIKLMWLVAKLSLCSYLAAAAFLRADSLNCRRRHPLLCRNAAAKATFQSLKTFVTFFLLEKLFCLEKRKEKQIFVCKNSYKPFFFCFLLNFAVCNFWHWIVSESRQSAWHLYSSAVGFRYFSRSASYLVIVWRDMPCLDCQRYKDINLQGINKNHLVEQANCLAASLSAEPRHSLTSSLAERTEQSCKKKNQQNINAYYAMSVRHSTCG